MAGDGRRWQHEMAALHAGNLGFNFYRGRISSHVSENRQAEPESWDSWTWINFKDELPMADHVFPPSGPVGRSFVLSSHHPIPIPSSIIHHPPHMNG